MINEKEKSRPPPSKDNYSVIQPPSPLSWCQNWKQARVWSSSVYTSKVAHQVLERIVRYNFSLHNVMICHEEDAKLLLYVARFLG